MNSIGTVVVENFAEAAFVEREHRDVIHELPVFFMELMEETINVVIRVASFNRLTHAHSMRDGVHTELDEAAVVPVQEVRYSKIGLIIYLFHGRHRNVSCG